MALRSAHLGCTGTLGGGGALPSRIHYAVVVPGWALACPRKYGVCIVLVVERNILLYYLLVAVSILFPSPPALLLLLLSLLSLRSHSRVDATSASKILKTQIVR